MIYGYDDLNDFYYLISFYIFQFPSTESEWRNIGKEFENRWQFPNCVGCVDGKHIAITPPPHSGSFYYNYKGFHSMVLIGSGGASCAHLAPWRHLLKERI